MKIRVVDRTVRRPVASRYASLFRQIQASLEQDGVDGQLRALVGAERWYRKTLRRWAWGLRDYAKRHPVAGHRLSLHVCATNGLVFAWRQTS